MNTYEQASRFFMALTGSPSPNLVYQTFCDPELPADWLGSDGKPCDYLASWWAGPFNADTVEKLSGLQAKGAGAFFCINGSSHLGRHQKDIDSFRTMVVDSDGAPYPQQWPFPPHAIVERDPTHWHAYWFIDGNTDIDSWAFSQMQLALWFGGDTKLTNADRVCRIPGFIHQKVLSNPMEYRLIHLAESQQRYNLPALMQGFALQGEKAETLMAWWQKRAGRGQVNMLDFDDGQVNINKYAEYLRQRADHSVQGQGGNSTAFKTAAAGRDYGLSPDMTLEMMLEQWNDECSPPWTEGELSGVVENAYRYAANGIGARSTKVFLDSPYELPPGASTTPVHRAQYDNTPLVLPTPKPVKPRGDTEGTPNGDGFNKNHTNNAQMFVRLHAPNREMFIHNAETFRFNGKVYDRIEPPVLEHMMFKSMEHMMPSSADLSGALRLANTILVGNAGNVSKLPAWREDPAKEVSSLVVFNNCIVDVATGAVQPHDSNLLTTNVLEYDYDPAATCPQWLAFIHGLWGDDAAMVECFQQWVGYCMVNDYSHQKIATLIGKPRSGKGTIGRIFRALLGEFNVASPALSKLHEPEILHSMSGKLVAIIPDAGSVAGPTKDQVMEALKSISGNDSVTFNRKYLSASTETLSARLMIMANEFPYFNDPSGAIVDRILFFPFRKSYAGQEDTTLTTRLMAELPGIANWGMAGLRTLREQGRFTESGATRYQKNLLRRQLSPALSFCNEMLTVRQGAFLTDQQIYGRYVGWATATGMFKMNRDQLMRGMESALDGVSREDRNGSNGFANLAFAVAGNAPEEGSLR